MHVSVDQLLSLRDGEPVDAQAILHVEACTDCAAEFARLQRLQQRMQSLGNPPPPRDAWQQIRPRVQAPVVPWRGRVAVASAAALAVAVVSGLLMREAASPAYETPRVATQGSPAQEALSSLPIERLVAQSRELDALLQHLPERPAVERVAMAATLDTIEQRVQWLDQQLTYAPDAGLNETQTYQLWRERVDLMDSLVKVRYVEGGNMSF